MTKKNLKDVQSTEKNILLCRSKILVTQDVIFIKKSKQKKNWKNLQNVQSTKKAL